MKFDIQDLKVTVLELGDLIITKNNQHYIVCIFNGKYHLFNLDSSMVDTTEYLSKEEMTQKMASKILKVIPSNKIIIKED